MLNVNSPLAHFGPGNTVRYNWHYGARSQPTPGGLPVPRRSSHDPSPTSQATSDGMSPTPAGQTPDNRRMAQALHHSRSPNTRAAYAHAWRRFSAWAQGRGAPPLPAAPERVAAYLTGLVHRSAGLDDPTAHEGVRRVLAGLARANARPQRQARGLTAGALAAIRATARIPRRSQGRAGRLETSGVADRRGLVDIALASTLRDGLLRRSEAAALRWGEVELLADGSGRLHVRQVQDATRRGWGWSSTWAPTRCGTCGPSVPPRP